MRNTRLILFLAIFLLPLLASCSTQPSETTTTSSTTTTSTTSTTTTLFTGGKISQDTTWSGEVLVNSAVDVDAGVTLTIQPGTRVKFKHYRGYKDPDQKLSLVVKGRLIAEGTANQPIYFTSDASDPQNGDWSMVRLVSPSGPCRISYAVFEFAQQGLNSWQANVLISNCVFRFNNWEGIYFESYCQATMEACQIYQNGYNGLAAEQFNNILMDSCEVWSNGTNGVHVDATALEIRCSRVHDNANGLSVDDNGTLRALGVASYDNRGYGVIIGEGSNVVELSNPSFSGNPGGTINGSYTSVSSPYYVPSSIDIGFTPDSSKNLSYTPGNQTYDKYEYVYPDDETRKIVRKIGIGLGLTWSLAWDGSSIWTSTVDGRIYKLNPVSGSIEAQFTAPGSQPWGMTYDGSRLWLVDFAEKTISKINPANGSVEATFSTPDPTAGCKGVAWDGTNLCVMGWASSKIYKMDRSGNLVSTIELDHGGGGGLAWDGNYFWVPNGPIYKYTAQGQAVGYIYPASEGTWDLEWDGQYLWATQRTNENWDDAKIFALEVLQLKTQ